MLDEAIVILPSLLKLSTHTKIEDTNQGAEGCSRESTTSDLEAAGSSPIKTLVRARMFFPDSVAPVATEVATPDVTQEVATGSEDAPTLSTAARTTDAPAS